MRPKDHLGYLEVAGEGVVISGEGDRVGDSHPGVLLLSTGKGNDAPTDISVK